MILLERQCKTTLSKKDDDTYTESFVLILWSLKIKDYFSSVKRLYSSYFYCIDWETLDMLSQRPLGLLYILNALSNTV